MKVSCPELDTDQSTFVKATTTTTTTVIIIIIIIIIIIMAKEHCGHELQLKINVTFSKNFQFFQLPIKHKILDLKCMIKITVGMKTLLKNT